MDLYDNKEEIAETRCESRHNGIIKLGARVLAASFLCIMIFAFVGGVFVKDSKADIRLPKAQRYVMEGTKVKFIFPKAKKQSKVKWRSTNPFAGKISKKGVFKAKKGGMTKVVASYKGKTYTCKVNIPDKNRKILLNKYKITITDKQTYRLRARATDRVYFMSRNTNIARVNHYGYVKGINPGTTTIIAKKGSAYTVCKVKVKSAGGYYPVVKKWLYNEKKVAIRKFNKKHEAIYGPLNCKLGKTVELGINHLNLKKVKNIMWSSGKKRIATVRPKNNGKARVYLTAHRLGRSRISAVVFYKSGKAACYTNTVNVINPRINTTKLYCFTHFAGQNRTQYVYFTGISPYSKVQFSVSNRKCVKATVYNNKLKLVGIRNGKGTVSATIGGKTYKVKYYVKSPKFGHNLGIIERGQKKRIKISGIGKLVPHFGSRNPNVVSVSKKGVVKGRHAGVAYIDVYLGNMSYTYRVEVAAKGMKTIINRAKYIVNNWTYSQGARMSNGYYDCSSLVWKGYKAYRGYNKKLGSKQYALPAASLFDYLRVKKQIAYFGFTKLDDLHPGDLFFYGDYSSAVRYSTPGRTLNIYHVAMYAGGGRVVEKGTPRFNYNSLDHIVGVGRVVNW